MQNVNDRRSIPVTNEGSMLRIGGIPSKRLFRSRERVLCLLIALLSVVAIALPIINYRVHADVASVSKKPPKEKKPPKKFKSFDDQISANIAEMVDDGRNTFRFDTFGDEAFWGDTVKLHKVIEGTKFGGVGPGVSPRLAINLGLKVDVDKLPQPTQDQLKQGKVNLDDPATTLALLKDNAVLGVTGFFNTDGSLKSIGLQCSLCHSTVDNSLTFGVGHRLDGWANRDLDGGKIIAAELAGAGSGTDLSAFCKLFTNEAETDSECTPVRTLLNSWGPGKFDVVAILDGKTQNPAPFNVEGDGTHTALPPENSSVLLPNALGLAGFNQHTWTGPWGTVTYWDALVANLIMFPPDSQDPSRPQPKGRFFDPRLSDATKFPIAAAHGFADRPHIDPDDDLMTRKMAALQFYLLGIPAPAPEPGVDFDEAAAARGDALFSGKAGCNNCHLEPLWTEPGWNLHQPSEIGIDSFQADRAPGSGFGDNKGEYKTMNLNALFVRENGLFMKASNKGRYYHDGRFATLLDVVNHYNSFFRLGLTDAEKHDLVEYLKSLPSSE
jgi:hypothetical protein